MFRRPFNGYKGLEKLDENQLKVLASDIRSDILSSVSKNGGHLSSNLGAVELTMSLLKNFDPLKDDILFDVGHQTYTYKILTGRGLEALRQTGGEPPFSDRLKSPFDKYNNGHAGTSISVGYGMALAKGLKKDESYTICVIGDSSVVSGLPMEALNLLSTDNKSRLIVIVNDNGMSISRGVGYMTKRFQKLRNSRFYFRTSSFLGTRMAKNKVTWKIFLKMRSVKDHLRNFLIKPTVFESMGIKYIGPIDGHDFSALDLAFHKAKQMINGGPLVVHVITKKGYGYKPAMQDKVGKFHGVNPDFDNTREMKLPDLSFTDLKALYFFNKMKEDKNIFMITPAMERGSGLEALFSEYPDRTLDVGIAEENAVTLASGLALKGMTPVVDIYSSFLQRSFDEVIEDVSRERIPMTFLVERAGLVGEDGESHHGLYDVAMASAIPYSHVYMPFDRITMENILSNSLYRIGPTFVRFAKDKPIKNPLPYNLSGSLALFDSEKKPYLLVAVGPMGYKLLEKADTSLFTRAILLDLLPSHEELDMFDFSLFQGIFCYDPYSTEAGSVRYFSSYLAKSKIHVPFKGYAFKNDFVTFGQCEDLFKLEELDVETVYQKILREVNK